MGSIRRRTLGRAALAGLVVAGALATSAGAGASSAHRSAGPHLCAGTPGAPGVLAGGTYPHGVTVKGFCAVNAGAARVRGRLDVTAGSALAAAFARNDRTHAGASSLTVAGDVVVGRGATLVLGCRVNPGGTGFPCIDDPSKTHPTLHSATRITGNLIVNGALGVIVHNSHIGGSLRLSGGGGGPSCAPPSSGVFAKFKSPVYSDLEDTTVGGDVRITGLTSCWLGVARARIAGSLAFTNDRLSDPDAIEVISNHVGGSLACTGNSSVWDSNELKQKAPFPRHADPNTVLGMRSGQCTLASPLTAGGPSGPGPF